MARKPSIPETASRPGPEPHRSQRVGLGVEHVASEEPLRALFRDDTARRSAQRFDLDPNLDFYYGSIACERVRDVVLGSRLGKPVTALRGVGRTPTQDDFREPYSAQEWVSPSSTEVPAGAPSLGGLHYTVVDHKTRNRLAFRSCVGPV